MTVQPVKQGTVKAAGMDWMLLFIIAVLIVLGLIMQYSASSYDLSLVQKQGLFAIIGFALVFVISIIPPGFLAKVSGIAFLLAAGLTGITYFIGKDVKGAKRWIEFKGMAFQPSEILKTALIMVIAAVICRYINQINDGNVTCWKDLVRIRKENGFSGLIRAIRGYLLMLALIAAAAMIVAAATKDLGTAVIIFGIGMMMLLVISPRIRYLGIITGGALLVAGGFVLAFPYRRGRVTAWLDLDNNTSDLGFQIKEGLYAIGSGGWFGKGLGKSLQKDVIPEPQTDMIFTIVCEELGIIGGIVLIILFILLLLRLKTIYDEVHDLYGKLIIAGTASHIGIQTIINLAVMTNLVPNTGVPLPFISYGGTSLLCLLVETGLVMSVRRADLRKQSELSTEKRV